jgi:penicillin-binding protein 2
MSRFRVDLRLMVVALVVLLSMGAVAAKLWWVQVARGEEYTKRIRSNSYATVRIPSIRGEIRDRNGIALVTNRASYEVNFYLPNMIRGYRERIGTPPKNRYQVVVKGMLKDREEYDIVRVVNDVVQPRLQELDLARDYNSKKLRLHYRNEREVPFTYIEDLDFGTLAKFAEHDVGLPGVDLSIRPARRYLYGSLAAHILGYVGPPEKIDREDAKRYDFYQADVEGKTEIELVMDKYLRGEPGVRVMQKNAKGVIEGELRVDPPRPGSNVYLTIDARIQMIAEQALRSVGRGAAVVVDPWTGDILAMASVPSYDPNKFIPSIAAEDWRQIIQDPTDPLTNRALSSYAPGSTYKVPVALAGLMKGMGHSHFTCSGGVQYGAKFMKCWIHEKGGSHGSISLTQALKVSCNAFFYQYGNAAGIENIVNMGEALGLGMRTDLGLKGESAGILPGPDWLAGFNPRERWSNGHTANVSIGQGYVLASPVQMAMVTATVANGGTCYYPRLVDRVVNDKGEIVFRPPPRVRTDLRTLGLTEKQIEMVRRGMWEVVNANGGTARRARIKDVEVAGKTGTAQFWRGDKKDNHTWFIAFAPYDKPRVAVCVLVQGAKAGGLVPAPIAAKIIEEILAMDNGKTIEVAALAPAPGSFTHIDEIDFGREIPAAVGTDGEDTDSVQTSDAITAPDAGRARTASPNIKPEADEQGRVRRASRVSREGPSENRKPNVFQRLFQRKKDPENDDNRRRSERRAR